MNNDNTPDKHREAVSHSIPDQTLTLSKPPLSSPEQREEARARLQQFNQLRDTHKIVSI